METANPLNQTQEVTNTQNPQDITDGASNAADFQSTAPVDALNQEAQNLSVQETGDPITGAAVSTAGDSMPWVWGAGIVLILVVSIVIIYRVLREESEADELVTARPARASSAKSAAKKPVRPKKTTRTGKKKPARKKTTAKRK